MAGVTITASVEAGRALRAAAKRCTSAEPWRGVGEHMLRSTAQTFDAGGRPERWAPLTTATLIGSLGRNAKKKRGGLRSWAQRKIAGRKILIQSGRLLRSITYHAQTHGVDVGTNLVYAATHQFGRGAIPARPFLVMQDGDTTEAARILERYITRGL